MLLCRCKEWEMQNLFDGCLQVGFPPSSEEELLVPVTLHMHCTAVTRYGTCRHMRSCHFRAPLAWRRINVSITCCLSGTSATRCCRHRRASVSFSSPTSVLLGKMSRCTTRRARNNLEAGARTSFYLKTSQLCLSLPSTRAANLYIALSGSKFYWNKWKLLLSRHAWN